MTKWFKHSKNDIPASIVVFLISIPLCLGIALASGAPLFAGIIAGFIGGIVVGVASDSHLGVSGPAAGLAVVVIGALASLDGNWQAFIVAVVIAGILQVILGYLKIGFIAYFFPSSVIKGMLTGIGLIIILKQIPHALGYDTNAQDDFSFFQRDGQNTFSEIVRAFDFVSPAAIWITIVSIFILALWEFVLIKKHRIFSIVNGPLVVLMAGIALHLAMQNGILPLSLSDEHLVKLPASSSLKGFFNQFSFPDFSFIGQILIWKIAITIALIASIETLLSVEAIDKLDREKNITPINRELKAQGLGNIISGLLGGLPLTQVILRSSTNITFGAKSKMSTIYHGILLLISGLTIASFLNMIPLASLAVILITVGYRLTKPSIYKELFDLGWEQFLPFIVTIVAILLTDLLRGISAGMLVGFVFIARQGYKNSHRFKKIVTLEGAHHVYHLAFAEDVNFFSKASVLKAFAEIQENSKVIIDCSRVKNMAYDVAEAIKDFESYAETKNIEIEKFNYHEPTQFINSNKDETISEYIQSSLTPLQSLEILKAGNRRFINNLKVNRNLLQQANDTSEGQHPFAVVLSCIDSRTSAELIFDLGLGDIFSVRIAGNIVNQDILGSMEFGCKVAGSKIIVVLGHTKCGAIKGACDHVHLGNLTSLLTKIKPAVDAETSTIENRTSANLAFVENVSTINVIRTVQEIMDKSPILKEMIDAGDIGIVGGTHDITTGLVHFYPETMVINQVTKE